jgi:Phosphotransferase enzyme family
MIDIPQDILTDIVGRMLGGVRVALTSWSVDSIGYPGVSPHSRGLFRVRGSANTSAGAREWSLILKAVQLVDDSPMSDETHPFYWKREALAYQSGLLPHQSDGLAAPVCFGVTERSDTSLWLWLEAIDEPGTDSWTISRFALAAADLGRFNGAYSGASALPAAPWLSRGLMRAWVADSAYLIECVQDPSVWKHPLLCDTTLRSLVPAILQLWDQREAWFTRLEQLPQTLCHHDFWRKNLLARGSAGHRQQTVAIDWEVVGLGAAGEDLGNLIGVSLLNFDIDAQDALVFADAMLDNYAQGLQRGMAWRSAGDARDSAGQCELALCLLDSVLACGDCA